MSDSNDFWHTLPRPIIGLSPMNGVTDHPFRHIQKKHGAPMLVFTEFTPVNGLRAGAKVLLKDLMYDESQRPVIAQIYGHTPDDFYQAAIVCCQLGFDGIDINMGCPSRSVTFAGSGAGLIRTPELAQEIVHATKRGVRDWTNGATVRDCPRVRGRFATAVELLHAQLPPAVRVRRCIPVSVKTRIGYDAPQIDEWIPTLLATEPAAISIHGRTLTQGYAGEADWDAIAQAVELARGSGVPILGNGDVVSMQDARERASASGVDGVLIGRASYGNPYVFLDGDPAVNGDDSASETEANYRLLHVAKEHARLFEQRFSGLKGYHFLPMRKHLGWYARRVPGASYLRRTLLQTSSVEEAVAAIDEYFDYRESWRMRS